MKTLTLVSMLVLLCAMSSSAEPVTSEGLAKLNGAWELDRKLSGSSDELMKALEVSWPMRQMGKFASARIELDAQPPACETCTAEVIVVMETPIARDEARVILDDVFRPGKDPRGRPTMDRFIYTEHGLEMNRTFKLPSGGEVRLHETRSIEDDPNQLVSTLVAWIDGTERASVRRIFRRADD